jgi:hypothetical protein
MLHRVCLSDLHLGDGRSLLSIQQNSQAFVDSLDKLCKVWDGKSEIGTLVLNGDIWEECVPSDLDNFRQGYSKSVLEASQMFFGYLLAKIAVKKIVWVPGNHDLNLWRLSQSSVVTPYDGQQPPEYSVLQPLFGTLQSANLEEHNFRVSYPIFHDENAGDEHDFPLLLFTHGHLLDSLVRGLSPEYMYTALRALGCKKPPLQDKIAQVSSIKQVARYTDDFTLALWRRYSKMDYVYSNYIMRRLDHPQTCPKHYICPAGFNSVPENTDPAPSSYNQKDAVSWLLDLALMDPELPTPVGSLRPTSQTPAFLNPSCFVFGHDHLGSSQMIVSCGVPFHMFDSGGWTSEFSGHRPHSHALVWRDAANVVPEAFYFKPPVDLT